MSKSSLEMTSRIKTTIYHCTCSQFWPCFSSCAKCWWGRWLRHGPILNEFPLSGGRPPMATNKHCWAESTDERGYLLYRKKGKVSRLASKNENSKFRSNCGAATPGAEEREIFLAQRTSRLSEQTLVGVNTRKKSHGYVQAVSPSLSQYCCLKGNLSNEGRGGEGMDVLHSSNLRSLLLGHSPSPCHHTEGQKERVGLHQITVDCDPGLCAQTPRGAQGTHNTS